MTRRAQSSNGRSSSGTSSTPSSATPSHQGLARTYWEEGRLGDAIRHYQRALEVRPNHPSPNTNLGVMLVRIARFDEARPHLERALARSPAESSEAFAARAASAAAAGRPEAGGAALPRVAAPAPGPAVRGRPPGLDPGDCARGRAARSGRRNRLAETALGEGGTHPIRLDTLAAGYAAAGRFPEAVRAAEAAERNIADGILAEQIRARLALYRAGTPYVERRVPAAAARDLPGSETLW